MTTFLPLRVRQASEMTLKIMPKTTEKADQIDPNLTINTGKRDVNANLIANPAWFNLTLDADERTHVVEVLRTDPQYTDLAEKLMGSNKFWMRLLDPEHAKEIEAAEERVKDYES